MSTPEVAPSPPLVGAPQYEFTKDQERVIAALGGRMQFVGLCALGIAILRIVAELINYRATGTLAITIHDFVYLCIGIWSVSAGSALRGVVETQGCDISHLMAALRHIRSIYTMIAFLLILALVLMSVLWIFAAMDGEPGHWVLIRGPALR